MKGFLFAIALALFAVPAMAQDKAAEGVALTPVKTELVCMVNDAVFAKPQIPVEVNGKTYYGCCHMCKERLAKDITVRMATDPVSGKQVDKADAVIGQAADGRAFYFESAENLKSYRVPVYSSR